MKPANVSKQPLQAQELGEVKTLAILGQEGG